ncbi:MAG: zinc ABC transporter substrate-binding protein [Erysipelotrichaceae bacterium]|nr:zinc ABC transporter substrate-binding protein [Erysipelotrichaceae bacterium]
MKKILSTIFIFIMLMTSASCVSEKEYDIITSCYPLYDLTTRIVGDKLSVKNLLNANVEPHDFEMTTHDVIFLNKCKRFFVNGLGLETYINDLPENILNKTITTTNDINVLYVDNTSDPHVWLSPLNAIKMMEKITEEIIKLDEDNKQYYQQNFLSNKLLFEKLDEDYKTSLTNLSSSYLISAHKAFNYLCDEYNLINISISGLSTEDEPSAASISALIKQIEGLNATTIFYEENVSNKVALIIANQTGLKCDVLDPIETLKDENEDYISIMYKNLKAICKALGGNYHE